MPQISQYPQTFCITGATAKVDKEMSEQILMKTVIAKFQGDPIFSFSSNTINNIEVNSQYPLVSAITMIAPSPDWFIGVHDFKLCDETTGKWADKTVQQLFPYDAGTDSGQNFRSNNQPTIPPDPIFLISNTQPGSFKSNDPIKAFGTFSFEKTFELNTQPLLASSSLKNPPNLPHTPSTQENIRPTSTEATVTAVISTPSPVFTSKSSSKAIPCKGSAKYKLTFKGEWTRASRPQDLPAGALFTSLIGCSHSSSYVMWKPGMKATAGVKQVAETGRFDRK